jgi:hypothetical protein
MLLVESDVDGSLLIFRKLCDKGGSLELLREQKM